MTMAKQLLTLGAAAGLLAGCGLPSIDEATVDRTRITLTAGGDRYEAIVQYSDADQRNAWITPLNWIFSNPNDQGQQSRIANAAVAVASKLCVGQFAPAKAELSVYVPLANDAFPHDETGFTLDGRFPDAVSSATSGYFYSTAGACRKPGS